MNAFEKFVQMFQTTMEMPQNWGTWHIVSILITVVACVVVGILMRKATNKVLRIFVGVTGAVLMLLEVMRQCVFNMTVVDGVAVWDIQWYLFPFHFCSLAMYIAFIAGIIKPGKVQDCLLSFLSTFAIMGGLIVMIVPTQVYCGFVYVNVQTMIHHGAMLVMATAILSSKHTTLSIKTVLKGAIVFAICVSLGMIANILAVKAFHIQETFNMFFISPYFDCPMPVFGVIYHKVPYIIFLLIYLAAFIGGTVLVTYIVKFFVWIASKIKKKTQPEKLSNV